MSYYITPGVNGGLPYIGGIPVPPETPDLIPPIPKSIFYTDGRGHPFLLHSDGTRLSVSDLYSAEQAVDSLYFGENEVQAAFIDEEEVFLICRF